MTTVHTDPKDVDPGLIEPVRGGGARLLRAAARFRVELVIAAACVLVELLLSTVQSAAISSGNITNIAQTAAPLVIIALGQLLVVVTAGIDLSVGSVFSLTGIVAAALLNHGVPAGVAVLGALGVGALCGLANGVCVAVLGLAPFIVTLVTYSVAASLAFVVTSGNSQPVGDAGFGSINSGQYLGIPNYLLYLIVLVVLLQLVLSGTTQGRWLYAVGSNERAARLIGVPVRGIKLAAYTASGLLASFAAVLSVSYLANAEATAGNGLELQAIAAVVIGGASLFGGVGSAVSALTGAVLVTVIQNAVNLLGVNSFYQGTITGLVILLAVLAERVTRQSRGRGA
ncbi:ABC transporter permease [Streptomyces sp. NPDC006332]|uniref:ABC transporter permease n=1 Tax=Streptomyces sp. NPDC006332 TaxID=3155456 RepID=UPI0033A990B4